VESADHFSFVDTCSSAGVEQGFPFCSLNHLRPGLHLRLLEEISGFFRENP
jgi:hypothetical protein